MQREKSNRRNDAWRKDEKVNCAARTHVNHENKQAPKDGKNVMRNNVI